MRCSLLRPARLLALLVALLALLAVPVVDHTGTAGAATADACGARVAKADGTLWSCSFVDDFSGTSLDLTKWTPGNTAVSGFSMNRTCFRPDRGHTVANGVLTLTLDRRQWFLCKGKWGNFSTNAMGGGISTYDKFSQTYGRFEARIKFPSYAARGLHGGFWMNPQKRVYGGWPGSGEIDVAEWFSQTPTLVYPSLHYSGDSKADTGWNCVMGAVDTFHTYAVEWSPTSMKFVYDGRLCFERSWRPYNVRPPAPFDQPFTTALVAAQGGLTNAPTPLTPKLAETVVDYVRVWR